MDALDFAFLTASFKRTASAINAKTKPDIGKN